MSRAYEALLAILDTAASAGDDDWAQLRARLRAEWAMLERVQITSGHGPDVHLKAYVNGYGTASATWILSEILTSYHER